MPLDPLQNPAFMPPGLWEQLGEAIFGCQRPLECVQIETTSACGGACIYCPHTTQARTWNSRHMAPETFASLWPLLRKAKRAHLQGWGEPLLNPHFFRFQALAARAGCSTSITTCGLKMDETTAVSLAQSGMDIIAFSLAGTDAESNSARAGVPFDRVCQSIRLLRSAISREQSALEIHFAYLLLADRMEAAAGLPGLMEELGVDVAVISTLDYLALPEHRSLALHSNDDALLERARNILEDVRARAGAMGKIVHYALPAKTPPGEGCRENISRTLYVDADGFVSPCVYLNSPGRSEARHVFGNTREASPMDIWQGPDFKNFRAALLAGEPDPACLDCPKRWEQASA